MAPQKHIDPAVAFAMIFTGIFIDLLQGVLTLFAIGVFISPALDVLAMIIFWMFPKAGPGTALVGILELIPVFDVLPMWSAYAIRIVIWDRMRSDVAAQNIGGYASANNPNAHTLWRGQSARRAIDPQAARQPRPGFGSSTTISSGPGPRPQQPVSRPTPKPNRIRL